MSTYSMTVAGLQRELPICKVTDDLYIGAFICFGDAELTEACGRELLKLLEPGSYDYLFTAEAKSIPLIHEMARQSGAKKYFIARKGPKAYMPDPIHVEDQSITTAGTQKLYDYLDDNPACMAAPISYTNDVRTIAAIDNFVSINNAVDIDLFGQVNAESAGIKHISGAGGQLDFVLGAYLSKGGKSFICLSSTFFNKKTGQLESRIRPTLENGSIITDTRANLHYLCTEYGCVNLKGLTTWEKAEALINVAHPDFREELIKEAEKMHIWRRSNKI